MRNGDIGRNTGKTKNKDKWKRSRKGKGKGGRFLGVVIIAANGDIQHGIVPHKERGSKGHVTRVGCRDIQRGIARKGTRKGSRKEKARLQPSGNGERGKEEPEK